MLVLMRKSGEAIRLGDFRPRETKKNSKAPQLVLVADDNVSMQHETKDRDAENGTTCVTKR